MQRGSFSVLGAKLVKLGLIPGLILLFSCALVIPNYHARPKDKSSDKPRVQVTMSPWGPRICDTGVDPTGMHTVRINIGVSQHNREYEGVAYKDNEIGARFPPAQAVSISYETGVGRHHLRLATFKPLEDGKVKITWQVQRVYSVVCCHNEKERVAEVF